MNREMLELVKRAISEGWDAHKIMAEFCSLQKELDAKICERDGYPDIAEKIRLQ